MFDSLIISVKLDRVNIYNSIFYIIFTIFCGFLLLFLVFGNYRGILAGIFHLYYWYVSITLISNSFHSFLFERSML